MKLVEAITIFMTGSEGSLLDMGPLSSKAMQALEVQAMSVASTLGWLVVASTLTWTESLGSCVSLLYVSEILPIDNIINSTVTAQE